jgi:hypothetical protein
MASKFGAVEKAVLNGAFGGVDRGGPRFGVGTCTVPKAIVHGVERDGHEYIGTMAEVGGKVISQSRLTVMSIIYPGGRWNGIEQMCRSDWMAETISHRPGRSVNSLTH